MLDLSFIEDLNDYDNRGAYDTLQAMMKRGTFLSVKFIKDREQYPCAWIEARDVLGFKYRLKKESLKGVLNYLFNGVQTDFDINPDEYDDSMPDADFQLKVMWMLINANYHLLYTPLFRENNGYISAILPTRKGKIIFKINRTPEILEDLREYRQAI